MLGIRCKARKVKCDEKRPSCSWCESHQLPCRYTGQNLDAREPPLPSHPSAPSESGKSIDAQTEDDSSPLTILLQQESTDRRLFELSLLHYYMVHVASNFPYIDPEKGLMVHQVLAIRAAIHCPCLLFAVYALATLHILVQSRASKVDKYDIDFLEAHGIKLEDPSAWTPQGSESDDPLDLATLHYQYLDASVKAQLDALENITEANADGICMTAIFLGQMALVQHTQGVLTLGLSTYRFPTHWIHLIRSYVACLETARPFLSANSVTALITAPHEPVIIHEEALDPIHCNQFPHLIDYVRQPEGVELDDETRNVYTKACAYLGSAWKAQQNGEPWTGLSRRVYTFLYCIPPHFFKLLEEGRPRALVMMAHLFVVSKPLDGRWWLFTNVPQVNIRGIAYGLPAEWQWAMRWPLAMIEREGALPDSTPSGPTT